MFIERIDATARSALLRVGIADLPRGADPVLLVGDDVRIPRMVAPTRRADARVVAFAVPIELLEGEPVLTIEAGSERIELPVPQRRSLRGVDAVRQVDDRVRALQSRVTDLTEQVRDQGTELPADGAVEPEPEADGQERDRLAAVEARADALNHELETVRHEAVATAERLQHELAEATDVAQRTAAELEGVAEELAQARADLAAQAAQPPEPQGVPVEEVAEMERRLAELDELRLQAEQRAHTTAIALTALLQRAERADVLEREMAELRTEFTALGELLVETREAFEQERSARLHAEALATEAEAERYAALNGQEALRTELSAANDATAEARADVERMKVEAEEMWQRAAEDAAALESARGVEATLERQLEEATVELAAVRAEAQQVAAALDEERAHLEAAEGEAARRDAELEQSRTRLMALSTTLAELRERHEAEVAKAATELERVIEERDAARAAVVEHEHRAEQDRLTAEAQLAAVQATADAHAAEAARLRERLEAVQADAEARAARHTRTQEALARLQVEAERRRDQAASVEQRLAGMRDLVASRSAAATERAQVQLAAAERGAAAANRVGRRVAGLRRRLQALAVEAPAPDVPADRELAHH